MPYTPVRAGLRVILVCMLAAFSLNSTAQSSEKYRDSLYTYARLKHRLHAGMQRFTIPGPELRCLQAAASMADSLAKRWPVEGAAADAFLPYWAAHPELDEDAARRKSGLTLPVPGACLADSTGYAAARARLTALQAAAYLEEHRGDTAAAFACLDTLGREFPFTGAVFHAKKLAIAKRDTAVYLQTLRQTPYVNFAEARRKELSWSIARTAAQKGFVTACLGLADSNALQRPLRDPDELRRCLLSFADLQSISSDCVFGRSKLPPFMRRHKRRLRRIYCYIVGESYTVMPAVVCRHLNSVQTLSRESLFCLGYLRLHLIQLNAFGQIYPDSLFENYAAFLRQLAYAGLEDMEDYASFRDDYLTGVKGLPSEYGYKIRRKGYELDYGTVPSAATARRRETEGLLPLEIASAQE